LSVQTTRLLVLGVVRLRQPTYGYEIERELTSWNADQWAGIARGSVYNQLKSLVRTGLLEFDSVSKTGNMPSKNLYRITEQGNAEFFNLLRAILDSDKPQPLDMLPVLCFLPSLSKQEIIDACHHRIARITSFLDAFDDQMKQWFPEDSSTLYLEEIFWLEHESFIAEKRWLEAFLTRVNAGRYHFREDSEAGHDAKHSA
jgi:DNA-binding PadR family transcriptional regulator